jgi:hypothetical protein
MKLATAIRTDVRRRESAACIQTSARMAQQLGCGDMIDFPPCWRRAEDSASSSCKRHKVIRSLATAHVLAIVYQTSMQYDSINQSTAHVYYKSLGRFTKQKEPLMGIQSKQWLLD